MNAGVTHPESRWLDRLGPSGAMILPLTDMGSARHGGVFWIGRWGTGFAAEFVSEVRAFPCEGVRDERAEALLAEAFGRGGQGEVRSLRRDRHPLEAACWLHWGACCLSRQAPPERA